LSSSWRNCSCRRPPYPLLFESVCRTKLNGTTAALERHSKKRERQRQAESSLVASCSHGFDPAYVLFVDPGSCSTLRHGEPGAMPPPASRPGRLRLTLV